MNVPLVSIIIPAYNAAKYISETLESALNQTYENIEVIVVDDGSTDDTVNIVEKVIDQRIILLRQINSGQCAASNLGIKHANGDYIKFLDADDILNLDHIKIQVDSLKNKNNSLALCEWGRFYKDIREAVFLYDETWKDNIPIEWILTSLEGKSMMGAWQWLIPRKILDIAGYWNEILSLNNDFDFSIRLILASDGIIFSPGALYYYRSGIEGLSQIKTTKGMESLYFTTFLGTNSIFKYEDSKRTRRACANRFQVVAFNLYPQFPELLKCVEIKIKELGGSDIKYSSNKIAKILLFVLNWKQLIYIKRIISFK